MTATRRQKKIAKVAITFFAINFIICGFLVFGPNLTCGHVIDMTSRLQVAWREANCPETLASPDPENADMEYQDMVSKQKAEETEKPASISP
ncbi:MAG: hypothetical protein ACAH80_07940 [Alphaproteobacteria bacterium]